MPPNIFEEKSRRRFDRQYDHIAKSAPGPFGRFLAVLRRPWAMMIRIPLGILLVLGGIFSFLPVLGIWMLPLGLLLLAVDLAVLRQPISNLILRFRRWRNNRRRNGRRENKQ